MHSMPVTHSLSASLSLVARAFVAHRWGWDARAARRSGPPLQSRVDWAGRHFLPGQAGAGLEGSPDQETAQSLPMTCIGEMALNSQADHHFAWRITTIACQHLCIG